MPPQASSRIPALAAVWLMLFGATVVPLRAQTPDFSSLGDAASVAGRLYLGDFEALGTSSDVVGTVVVLGKAGSDHGNRIGPCPGMESDLGVSPAELVMANMRVSQRYSDVMLGAGLSHPAHPAYQAMTLLLAETECGDPLPTQLARNYMRYIVWLDRQGTTSDAERASARRPSGSPPEPVGNRARPGERRGAESQADRGGDVRHWYMSCLTERAARGDRRRVADEYCRCTVDALERHWDSISEETREALKGPDFQDTTAPLRSRDDDLARELGACGD